MKGENVMKSPYCQKEMQLGYIPNGSQPMQWIPDDERPSIFSFSIAEQGVPLVNQFQPIKMNGYKAEAHDCPDCKVIVAPTKNWKNWLWSVNFGFMGQLSMVVISQVILTENLENRTTATPKEKGRSNSLFLFSIPAFRVFAIPRLSFDLKPTSWFTHVRGKNDRIVVC